MENENWNCSNFSMEIPNSELNCSSEQLSNCFFNPNWENSMDQNDPFESALSSMVSSPAASNAAIHGGVGGGGDNVVLRELIGRLGSICNSGEISPQSYIGKSAETSCYSTPLNSPPKLNLSMMDQQQQIRGNFAPFSADPGFAERAARYSCFGGSKTYGSPNAQFGQNETEFPSRSTPVMESGKLSRASSFQSRTNFQETKDGNSVSNMKFNRLSSGCSTPETAEFGDSREESSVSEQISGGVELGLKAQNDGNGRKRKAIPKGKTRDIPPSPSPSATKDATKAAPENGETNAKRSKSEEGTGNEKEAAAAAAKAKAEPKVAEPPKDYIHVRARRGQATDSHSLAERVRREKISERMKFLQDLVPGCNKVTGKAVMLDEIINYVQSLQRQVEFLSMKLSTVNPRMEFNAEALLSKDVFQSRATLPPAIFPVDSSASAFPYQYHQSQGGLSVQSAISNGTETPFLINPLNAALRRGQGMQQLSSIDGFGEASPQVLAFWEDDLHSVVQMGFGQNQPECFNGAMAAAQMKIEL